jgi:ribose 5-phosphate isomerase B
MNVNEKDIKDLVRHVLLRTIRQEQRRENKALTADAVAQYEPGSTITVALGTLITPMARETALTRHIQIVEASASGTTAHVAKSSDSANTKPVVAIGADHGGFPMKEILKEYLADLGYAVIDMGTNSKDAVDYPDFAYAVAQQVANGKAWRGIVLDGAGIGSCMVANKVPGVRAAMCYDDATAKNSRLHNDSNVLTLGAGLLGPNLLKQIVKTWLSTDFEGGRHQKRIDKIIAVETRHLKTS